MIEPRAEGDFGELGEPAPSPTPLLVEEVGALPLPWAHANAVAVKKDSRSFEIDLGGRRYSQRRRNITSNRWRSSAPRRPPRWSGTWSRHGGAEDAELLRSADRRPRLRSAREQQGGARGCAPLVGIVAGDDARPAIGQRLQPGDRQKLLVAVVGEARQLRSLSVRWKYSNRPPGTASPPSQASFSDDARRCGRRSAAAPPRRRRTGRASPSTSSDVHRA